MLPRARAKPNVESSASHPDPALWPESSRRTPRLQLRRAPLLAAAVWFAVGEVLARHWQPVALLLLACAVLITLTMVALARAERVALFPLAAVWIVVGLWCAQVRPAPVPQTALAPYADGLSRMVRGRVERARPLAPRTDQATADRGAWGEQPEDEPAVSTALQIDLAIDQAEYLTPDISAMRPVRGGVRAAVVAPAGTPLPELRCGDVVEVPLRLRVPERYRDPGAWQYADYLLEQGIGFRASARAGTLRVLGSGAGSTPCRLAAMQAWASGRLMRYAGSRTNRDLPALLRLNSDDVAMLSAMLFGDRAGLTHRLRLGFERTGSFHLFVVSGMHVALIAGGIFLVLRRLRLWPWLATLVTIAFTAGYALLTGFGAPVQRALAMTTIFLLARLLAREGSVLNALGAAALGVLVWSPGAVGEASFQMTFLAIVAIAGIAVPLGERSFLPFAAAARRLDERWRDHGFEPRLAQFRVMLRAFEESLTGLLGPTLGRLPALLVRVFLWAAELALIGIVAEMVMALPMSLYFHRATIFALPTNMVSVPVVAVLVPLAILAFAGTLLGSWAAVVPAALTAALLHGVTWTISRVSSVQAADIRVPPPVWWIAALALAGWAFCCWAVRQSRRWALTAAILLPAITALVLWPEPALLTPATMEVTAIDVGQGDSLLVAGGDGRTLLVDAGGPVGGVDEAAAATSIFDVGEEVVAPYLWQRRVRRLDAVVLTHAHSDHMGGMPAILRDLRPRELWVGVDSSASAFTALLTEAKELGIAVRHLRAGDAFDWGEQHIEVLAPAADYTNTGAPRNDDSLVLRISYGKSSVLLEGDAEAPSERAMVASGRVGPVTLLKVGHHGSRTSTTPEFLAATSPKDAVISVGLGNTFGHPRPEILSRLAAAHAHVYRTDQFGVTTFLLGRDGRVQEVTGAYN